MPPDFIFIWNVTGVNKVNLAMPNHLSHERLGPAMIHAEGAGPAINLNAGPLSALDVAGRRLPGVHGRPCAVLHQYGRGSGSA